MLRSLGLGGFLVLGAMVVADSQLGGSLVFWVIMVSVLIGWLVLVLFSFLLAF